MQHLPVCPEDSLISIIAFVCSALSLIIALLQIWYKIRIVNVTPEIVEHLSQRENGVQGHRFSNVDIRR